MVNLNFMRMRVTIKEITDSANENHYIVLVVTQFLL